MAEQSLDLLKRIADQLAITFHGAHRCRRRKRPASHELRGRRWTVKDGS